MLVTVKQQLKNILQYAITVVSCVAIIVFGISFLSKAADPVTTTIGENISTNDLIVYSNATTTLNHYIGGALITATTTLNGVTYVWPSSDGSNGQALTTNNDGTVSWISLSGAVGSLKYGAAGTIPFYSSAGTTATGTTNALLYWDDTNARLGIGTSSPYANLSVWGAGTSGATAFNVVDSASTTLFSILDSGNVGIGTTSPYAKLSVVGETVAEYFTATSTTATSTFAGGLSAASSLYVLQNGNVGIGTAAPTSPLHIVGGAGAGSLPSISAASSLILQNNLNPGTSNALNIIAGATGLAGINFGDLDSESSGQIIYGNSLDIMAFFTDNDERMRINSSGNVGIGTSSPYAKLSVVGQTVAEYFTATSTTATSTFAFNIGSPTGYNLTLQSTDITGATGNILLNPYGGRVGVASSSPFATFAVEQQDNDTIVFLVADSGTSTPHLKIDGAGVTTIGQLQTGAMSFDTNAGALTWVNLPVDSTVASNTVESFTAQIDSNDILTVYALSDGAGGVTYPSVGIGTTTPSEQLSVAKRMYIGGIGTSTIQNNLYVMGTLRSTVSYTGDLIFANNFRFMESLPVDEYPRALILKSHTLDDLLYIDEDAKIGIGTTTPAVALTVNGDAMANSWLTYEVAEMDLFPEDDNDVFEEGDLLSISDETGGFVKASSYDNYPIIGIAKEVNLWNSSSTKPAILGTFTAKVSTENGDIYIGDYLTKSSIDGVAMRADEGDQTVGLALEDYYGGGTGIIKVFINVDKTSPQPSPYQGEGAMATEGSSSFSIADSFDWILDKFKLIGITMKNGLVQAREFVADKITVKQLCLDEICIDKNQLKELMDKNEIQYQEEVVNNNPPPIEQASPPAEQGEAAEEPVMGCTDSTALNYNSDAEDDDGSCAYLVDEIVESNSDGEEDGIGSDAIPGEEQADESVVEEEQSAEEVVAE